MFVNMPLINSQLGYTLSLYPHCGLAVFFDVSIASFGNADPLVPNRRRPSPTISHLLPGSGLAMDCCLLVLDKHLDGIYQDRFYTPSLQHFRCYSSTFSPPKSPLSHTSTMPHLKPLPDYEGPKLEAFTDDFAAHDIEFLKALWSGTAHGNVFKTKIDGKIYAVKLVNRVVWFLHLHSRRLDLLILKNSSSNRGLNGKRNGWTPQVIQLFNKQSRITSCHLIANAAPSVD